MRRAILTLLSTIAGLVLLLTFKSSTGAVTPALGASGSSSAAPGSAGCGSAGGSGTKTVTGSSVDTRWGPVQVRITLTNGKITAADAIDYPTTNGRDQEINSYAIPTLNSEAVSTGTAGIDLVSGATYTSEGNISSLQSALDQAS